MLLLPSPSEVACLDAQDVPRFVLELAALQAAAAARLVTSIAIARTPEPEPAALFLTPREAAELCRCSERTVRRRMHDGTWCEGTHYHRPGKGEPRFARQALVAWLESPAASSAPAIGLAYADDIPPPARRRRLLLLQNK